MPQCYFLCQQRYEQTAGPICMKLSRKVTRCGVTMGQPDYIFVNSEKPRNAAMRNMGTGFVVLFAPQLVILLCRLMA